MDYTARRHEILEAMESCRADGDLNDPNFVELAAALGSDAELHVHFERVQRADAAIKAAMAEVPLSPDLAAHVMRRLGEAAASQPIDPLLVPVTSAPDAPSPLEAPSPAVARRFFHPRMFAGLAALSASAAVAALVWFHVHQPPPWTYDEVLTRSMRFFGGENSPPGQLISEVAPPAEYPISRDLWQSDLIRWRRVKEFLGSKAVAYDLPPIPAISGRATLYVVRRNVVGLPSSPPLRPNSSTGGNWVGAWESGGLLYVLVVQGDDRAYPAYFDRGPLT